MHTNEQIITEKLHDLWSDFKGNDAEWTRATFCALEEIGNQLGYKSLYSNKCGGPGEWLWDFVWIEHDPTSQNIMALPLVVESEWTTSNVQYDFEKLIVSRAQLRLIIFQAQSKEQADQEISKCRNRSALFRGDPAKYLAACWIYGESNQHSVLESWFVQQNKIM